MNYEIHHGDCLETMRTMADGSVDIVITSPPYNLGVSSGGGIKGAGKNGIWAGAALTNGYDGHDDAMPVEEYKAWQKEILREAWRLLSPDGAIFYNHKPRVQNGIQQTPLDYNPDLPLRQIIVWDRGAAININHAFFLVVQEWIVCYAKPSFRLKGRQVSMIGDVWRFPPEQDNGHPAPFPLQLPCNILQAVDHKVVLDPFMGSGTVGVACAKYGKKFIGIEKSKKYLDMASERISRAYTCSLLSDNKKEEVGQVNMFAGL